MVAAGVQFTVSPSTKQQLYNAMGPGQQSPLLKKTLLWYIVRPAPILMKNKRAYQ